MIILAAPAMAALVAFLPPHHHHTKKKHHATAVYDAAKPAKDPGVVAERALRRRLVRMARIAFYERRESELSDFLIHARTETPVFTDPTISSAGAGISIGPTSITTDFLGAAIVHARVHNASSQTVSLFVMVTLSAADGRTARASTVVEGIAAGQARAVELMCPQSIVPVSAVWSASAL